MTTSANQPLDLRAEVRRGVAALEHPSSPHTSTTSDLSIDEEFNLHAVGWEPVELVSGLSVYSVPAGLWNWGQGEITSATFAHSQAFATAIARLHRDAARAGGHGVVGVSVERFVHPTHIEVTLVGTAVRPVNAGPLPASDVFVSDLSSRDFSLLVVSGWQPLGLATGASFVYAPRRTMGAVLQQQSQNVELANFTEAMYSARAAAMERMQAAALALRGDGVVAVRVTEGPLHFASHAVGFAAWGTVVRSTTSTHQRLAPLSVVSLNDPLAAFDITGLR